MGRELRRVPADWEHPKDESGHYIPLHGGSVSKRIAEWDEDAAQFEKGLRRKWTPPGEPVEWVPRGETEYATYAEYAGERPDPADYMPDWSDAERTHVQMYEDTTEGTPISPVFATVEELARWLADTGASAFGGMTATYEQWLATCQGGWAPSAVFTPQTGLISGVAASTDRERRSSHGGRRNDG